MWQGWAFCLLIAVVYVSSLYIKRTPGSRQHPETVKWRMLSVLLASSVAWIPFYQRYKQVRAELPERTTAADFPTPRQLLGLQLDATCLFWTLQSLATTVTLFAGPMLYTALTAHERRGQELQARTWIPSIYGIRDYIVGPLTEEWCFRACMAPMLLLEGVNIKAIVFTVPLFFGVCHLHHARELLLVHGWPIGQVLPLVCFQMLYTTAFGWFATWVFLSSGRLAPAVAVHALCNYWGLPPFAQMARHKRSTALVITTVVGILGFICALSCSVHRGIDGVWARIR